MTKKQIAASRNRQSPHRDKKIKNLMIEFLKKGYTYSQMATNLNSRGFSQFNMKRWSGKAVEIYCSIVFRIKELPCK